MRKILSIIILVLMIFNMKEVFATNSKYTLNLKIINKDENCKIYMLLPRSYIKFAMEQDGLSLNQNDDLVKTLRTNTLTTILIDKDLIEDKTYEENGIEYVQILLEPNSDGEYLFNIAENYGQKDMKYRVVGNLKDYIMHIDNFKEQNGICKIEYDYKEETIKNTIETKTSLLEKIKLWQVILVVSIIIIIFIINRKLNS